MPRRRPPLSTSIRRLALSFLLASVLLPLSAAAQRESAGPEVLFAEAHRLYADQLYEQAAEAFARFREENPDHPSAAESMYYEAVAALASGREERSVELLNRFQRRYPIHPLAYQARLALGKYFYETEDFERSIETFEQVLEDEPPAETSARALYWMAESALQLGRLDDALRYFQQAADDYRETDTAPGALYAMAYAQVEADRYEDAARSFEVLANRYPDSNIARNIGLALAEVYYELGQYQRVVDEIKRRLPNLSPEAAERGTFLLAESYNQLGDHENAIIEYRRFTEGNPTSPYHRRAIYGLAWNYYFQNSYEWAAEQFELVRRNADDDLAKRATYYEAVNRKLLRQGRLAATLLETFMERWPNHELADRALHELALTYYELRMWDEANLAFDRLAREYPDSDVRGDAVYMRGATQVALGDFDDALRSFNQAIELDAAPPELRAEVEFQKAWLLYRNGRFEESAPGFLELYRQDTQGHYAADALFWAAESHYQTNELGTAERLFEQYIGTYEGGKHVDAAHYALGWVYFRQGRYRQAADEFNRFLNAYRSTDQSVPYRTDALLRLADSYYALKRYPEAISAYARVAAEGESYAVYQMGQAYTNMGDAFQAITTFSELVSEYPDSEWRDEAEYQLAYLYFLNQDYGQAVQRYESLIRAQPNSPLAAKAQYSIGDALYNAGRLNEAVQAYRTVLERYPRSPFAPDAASSLYFALMNMNDEAQADRIIEEFARENPDSPVVDQLRFRRAEAKFQAGRRDEAYREFQQFARSSSNTSLTAEANYYMGVIEADRGREQQAEGHLRSVLEGGDGGRAADAARRLGALYLASGRHDDALSVYRRLQSIAGNNPRLRADALYGQSMALLNLGQTREAESLLTDALQAAPDDPSAIPAMLGLARIHEQQGRADQAAQQYRQVVERSRDEVGAEALYRLGNLLLERGQPRIAIEELSRMPVLYAGNPEWEAQAFLIQARAYRRLGQAGEAARMYDRVIQDFADTSHARVAATEKESL